jgi:pimeloyl-ACP methyl ester carboxylesterase
MADRDPILEEPVKGSQKLFIIFGGKGSRIAMPPFEFYQASKILDENRVFVRCFKQSWYHGGLPGISKDVEGTRRYLAEIIDRYAPEETVMVGNSMGGFAAILFAALIGDSRAVAFAPQTFISPRLRWKHRDRRWKGLIYRTYMRTLFSERWFDLAALPESGHWRADIHYASTHVLDSIHAQHLANRDHITLHEHAEGGHRLVKVLRDTGQLPKILLGRD